MKIGVVSGGRQIGGAEVLCVLFADWLKSKGLDVWLHVGTGGEDQLSGSVKGSKARVVGGLHEAADSDAVFLYGTKLIGQHKSWAERINRAGRVFAFVGGFNTDYADPHHLRVDSYWCEAKNVGHYLTNHLRVPADKVKVCRIPVVPEQGTSAKKAYPDRFTFGLAARLYTRKQPLAVVEAFEALNMPNTALVVIGGGPLGRAIKKKARTMSLPVHLVGLLTKHKRYLQWLRGLDCLVSASEWEGCSVTMRDAMVLGVPVIGRRGYYVASDGTAWPGGTPELIEHGKTGLLFCGKIDSLVDCMRWMVEHPDEREDIVKNARRYMSASNHASAKRTLEILAGR